MSINLSTIIFFLSFIVVIIVVASHFSKKIKNFEEENKRAEKEFEMSVLSQFNTKISTDKSIQSKSDSQLNKPIAEPESVELSDVASLINREILQKKEQDILQPIVEGSLQDSKLKIRKSVDEVVSKLQSAGIVKNVEGPIQGQFREAQNMLIHLKSGRTILIVPFYESENFLINNLPKTDWILFILKNGESVVIEKLNKFIAEQSI